MAKEVKEVVDVVRNYLIDKFEVFQDPVFGDMRTIYVNKKFYFYGIDVARALGYGSRSKNEATVSASLSQAVKKNVSEDHRIVVTIPASYSFNLSDKMNKNASTAGFRGTRASKTTLIDEAGMYQLVMKSTLPDADVFQRWVVECVLPSIRENSFYALGMEDLSEEDKRECVRQVKPLIPAMPYRETKIYRGDEWVINESGILCRREDILGFRGERR